ncbi:DUF2927 domain-containing protein [Aquibacillus albus]|uniref:Peptidase M10 metallopeptidase domain-containing protein n=1 Tax=Aquibacillus albus TaxID=1168171 RepID=A0ABS2MWE5_9BACI|nr:DUF2927 domain-containing protein [Aquibacillus albus]MBM7570175.1 hypothetical protein [Aquibacillus albus]
MKKMFLFLSLFLLTGCIPEPEIDIDGVQQGEVYVNDQTINIDEEAAGEYTLHLNGNVIQNDHTVSGNGEYELTITAKRWWNEITKTIAFEIDDEPPAKPSFKDEVKPLYYKEANFELEKEEDVTYKVKIDYEPFDISQAYTKEGTHKLYIQSIKDNGLVADRKETFEIDNRTYSRHEVDAFKKFFFHNEDQEGTKFIKWSDHVGVHVYGEPTATDMKALESNLQTINQILPVDLNLRESQPFAGSNRINVHFVPTYQFKDYGFNEELRNNDYMVVGYAMPTLLTHDDELFETKILIGTDTDQQLRKTTILHELMHALGFYGHFENNPNSILYPYTDTNLTELSSTDKKLIEILYRKDIKPGMTEAEVEQTLNDWIVK